MTLSEVEGESKDPFPVIEEYGFFDYAALWAAPLRMTYSVRLRSETTIYPRIWAKKSSPGEGALLSLSKNLVFDRLAEGKKGPKTSKPKASAYIGTVVLWFAQ